MESIHAIHAMRPRFIQQRNRLIAKAIPKAPITYVTSVTSLETLKSYRLHKFVILSSRPICTIGAIMIIAATAA